MAELGLGEQLEEYRARRQMAFEVAIGAAGVGWTYFLSRSIFWIGAMTVLAVGVPAWRRRVRFAVHEKGIVVQNIRRKSFRWDEIERFERSGVFGRPGKTGQVVVAGFNHEIGALHEPSLDERLIHLNDLLRRRRS